MMICPHLPFVCCVLSCSLLLLHCTSLSQDGLILLKIKEEDWRGDQNNRNALSNWNEYHQNPCGWTGITCDAFNSVTKVDLTGVLISGNLTSAICGLANLTVLILQYNEFSGPFRNGLLSCKRLWMLDLSSNNFSGTLPSLISELNELRELQLQNCNLLEEIPDIFGNLTELKLLDLSQNRLQGIIPSSLLDLISLRELLQNNNNLSGQIPASIMGLSSLQVLDLSHNDFSGQIPANIHQLRSLTTLDLSDNALTGRISFKFQWDSLIFFNISSNKLSGCIPDSLDKQVYKDKVLPNPMLCGGPNLNLTSCPSPNKRLATILVAPLFIVFLALCCMCLCRWSPRRKPSHTPSWKTMSFISTEVDEAYILSNLKKSNVIGSGSAGKVYKLILHTEQELAVKKIHENRSKPKFGNFRINGELEENKVGDLEVDILGLIRHTNIIKLLCCISSEEADFKLLVYEFMSNGNLFECLHGDPESELVLQWPMRYNIALGAARGLSYVHHDCSPPILHRDVKSSNILLDGEFEAKIADFGISRLLDGLGDEYMASGYVGSHGYIAPEYGHVLKVSEKSDVSVSEWCCWSW